MVSQIEIHLVNAERFILISTAESPSQEYRLHLQQKIKLFPMRYALPFESHCNADGLDYNHYYFSFSFLSDE